MKVIIYLLGFGHIALCSILILYTRESVNTIKKLLQTYQLKYLSPIPAVYGLLFLISAASTVYPWVFIVIGMLGLCEALVAFIDPKMFYSRFLDWYFEQTSEQTQRLFGIIGIIVGTAILTWIK